MENILKQYQKSSRRVITPKIVDNSVVLDEDEVRAICKVNKVFDLFFEMERVVKSMSEKEFRMLERSLEATKEEMENNG